MYSASISARVNPHWTNTHTKIGRKSSGRGREGGRREERGGGREEIGGRREEGGREGGGRESEVSSN